MNGFVTAAIIFGFVFTNAFSQFTKSDVLKVIDSIRLDTLIRNVEELTGETDIILNGEITRISSRASWPDSAYTKKAEEYLYNKLGSYGYEPKADTSYPYRYGNNKSDNFYRHIYAIKQGKKFPEKRIYFTAHLDCAGDFWYLNYGADDDASGTAAVMEAARILANVDTDYSIVFMLINFEETGYYAPTHFNNDTSIIKDIFMAIDLDMIAYDLDDDGELYVNWFLDESKEYADLASGLVDYYKLELNPIQIKQHIGNTVRFHDYQIPNITFTETVWSEKNPNYHSNLDRVKTFNLKYFLNMTKLSIATLLTIANSVTTDINNMNTETNAFSLYPNPASSEINIILPVNNINHSQVEICDIIGNTRKADEIQSHGSKIKLNISSFNEGLYTIKIKSGTNTYRSSFIKY